MGMVYANIRLQNGSDLILSKKHFIGADEIRELEINILVDTGSVCLALNEEICQALGLEIIGHRPSVFADGRREKLPVTSPVTVWFEDRSCNVDAVILPGDNDPLLGAVPMELLDLWINPAQNLLTGVHPEGPVWSLR